MHSGEQFFLRCSCELIGICNTERDVIHQKPFVKPHSYSTIKHSIEYHYPAALLPNTNQQLMTLSVMSCVPLCYCLS
jgi:hypothetical protein